LAGGSPLPQLTRTVICESTSASEITHLLPTSFQKHVKERNLRYCYI